jgi:hypothetical protein
MFHYFKIGFVLTLFCLIGQIFPAEGSHIRAGEITAERLSDREYRFTLFIYGNRYSGIRDDYAQFDFGDGTSQIVQAMIVSLPPNRYDHFLNEDTYLRRYQVTKTYNGNGTYRVSYKESYRNAGIRNMTASDNTDFYIETYVSVSSFTLTNRPLQLTIPPIDHAIVNKLFVHNAGAYDPDGDSLSYRLITPRAAPGVNVNGYFTPPHSSSFTLNPITGDLVWDAPTEPGLYNVAFIIEEWRRGVNGTYSRIGFVTRDMQIEVKRSNNNPPVVHIPEDTCVVAGSNIIKTIRATDPDNDLVYLSANPSTYFTVTNPQLPVATGTFNWTTTCLDVRAQPYFFVFKVKDGVFRDTLTNYKTWGIKVKGPKPTGLQTTATGNNIVLNWDPYTCSNAEKIKIYRLACDSVGYQPQPCDNALEGFPGYVKIGEVPIGATTFTDNGAVQGISRGTSYCYLLVAKFPWPNGGESYPSEESCENLLLDVPLLTNVTVLTTSATTGSIQVDWLEPTDAPLLPPYSYEIARAEGINGTAFVPLATVSTLSYTDTNLDTESKAYRYRVTLVTGNTSEPASSIFVRNTPADRTMHLVWENNANWQDDSVYLYRSINNAPFELIHTMVGNPGRYTDNQGLNNCDTVCYYVDVYASYCMASLVSQVYINRSQLSCGVPVDGRPPRVPDLTVKGCEGDLSVFFNLLDWNDVSDPLCSNIRNYNVYFSEYEDTELALYATTDYTVTDYVYYHPTTTAGCFAVSAVNKLGVEGGLSQKICVDDCVYYELPNLITPNDDSLNDRLQPFPVPRGVESVKFSVFNRWGALVYDSNDDIFINWKGLDNAGDRLLDGVYYYSAELKFYRRLYRKDEKKVIKSWVHILDQSQSATRDY